MISMNGTSSHTHSHLNKVLHHSTVQYSYALVALGCRPETITVSLTITVLNFNGYFNGLLISQAFFLYLFWEEKLECKRHRLLTGWRFFMSPKR